MRASSACFVAFAFMLSWAGEAPAQTTSGSLTGTVTDAQGSVVPGAAVSVTNDSRRDTLSTVTDQTGRFVFSTLAPARYTLKVEAAGFKTFVRSDLLLHANDRLSVGTIRLEIGTMSETVEVAAKGTELQTTSAERGYALAGKVLEDVAVNSRSYLALVVLSPGVVHTSLGSLQTGGHAGLSGISANGARGNQNNLTLDGIGNVDTGNNGDQLATLSLDAVAEFKVLTANYQAEYGRSSSAQISVVTKSGGRDFHGSGYWYHRHDGLNANNWRNNRDGQPRNLFRFNDFGYTAGGPVFIPGKFNQDRTKLFFFAAQEFQRQLRPQGRRVVTMPTALEREGDFSQTVDNSGNPFPFIRDPLSGLPCNTQNTSGCFQDGGVLGRIPKNRLYTPGLAILKAFPLPNAPGNRGFNYESQISDEYPRREDMFRLDFHPNDKWRIFARYINNNDEVVSNYGSFVLGANFPLVPIRDARPGSALALSATRILGPTMVNELTLGFGHNQINIDPTSDGLTRAKMGLTDLPLLFPDAIQNDFVPRLRFGGSRLANTPSLGTNNAPFYNYNTTIDFIDNFTKVWGAHSLKTGIYVQQSRKDQTSFAAANGDIEFGDSSTNPFDTGYGFANAAIGVYRTFNQASQYALGQYRYTNVEWYAQDNWKVTSKLTLDYGLRLYWIQPQYDRSLQTATFLPDEWDASKAPRLFVPAFDAAGRRIGIDPVTGQVVSALDIGKIVPGSGDLLNGIRAAGLGVSKYLQRDRGIHWGPRFGLAWDLTGRQNVVIRGGAGVFYDRYQGNETFDMITNPPTTVAPTLLNGLLRDVDPKNVLLAPSSLHAFSFDGKVPTVYNYNLGLQLKMPWEFVLDLSYVGSQSRHLLQRININAVPYGAAYKPENQDPTRVRANPNALPGSNALDANFLRPYRGYDNINLHAMGATANYNSLQTTLNRRFLSGLLLGASYTWSRTLGTADGDGSFFRIDGHNHEGLYAPLSVHRLHNLAVNFVYELPRASKVLGDRVLVRALLDDWQISGLYRYQSGAPYGVGFSIPGIGNVQLTGSQTEGARTVIGGDPGSGHSGDPYRQLNASAFTIPSPASIGLESARNYLIGPGVDNWDLSLQKSFPLGRGRRLQLRVDTFNALNHTQFSGVNSTLNVRSFADPTPVNLPFDASGKLVDKNGFGTVSGARDPRILQLVARIQF